MTFIRRDVFDPAVLMLNVVPVCETAYPYPCVIYYVKAVLWPQGDNRSSSPEYAIGEHQTVVLLQFFQPDGIPVRFYESCEATRMRRPQNVG